MAVVHYSWGSYGCGAYGWVLLTQLFKKCAVSGAHEGWSFKWNQFYVTCYFRFSFSASVLKPNLLKLMGRLTSLVRHCLFGSKLSCDQINSRSMYKWLKSTPAKELFYSAEHLDLSD